MLVRGLSSRVVPLVLVLALFSGGGARADRAASARLAWVPADVHSVLGAAPGEAPLLKWLAQTMGTSTPDCWAKELAAIEQTFQIWRAPGDTTAMILYGRLDRASMEHCMSEVLRAVGVQLPPLALKPKLSRHGTITEVTLNADSRAYVGWGGRWAIWHEDRNHVERMLAATRGPKRAHSQLHELLDRLGVRPNHMWAVSIDDFAGPLLGIPSRGCMASIPFKGADHEFLGTFLFDSPEKAQDSARALKQSSSSPQLAPEIRAFIASMRARVQHDSLEFTFEGAQLVNPAFIKAVEAKMKSNDRVSR